MTQIEVPTFRELLEFRIDVRRLPTSNPVVKEDGDTSDSNSDCESIRNISRVEKRNGVSLFWSNRRFLCIYASRYGPSSRIILNGDFQMSFSDEPESFKYHTSFWKS